MQDSQIINKVLTGDAAAFEFLVKKYQKLLLYAVYSILKDPASTEDIVQDAFVQAYIKLDTLREPAGFFAWIKKIAINLSYNVIAQGKKYNNVENTIDGYDIIENIPTNFTPEDYTLNEEMRIYLKDFVDALPEKLKIVLIMREVEGMDYEQISSALNIPVGTVRSRLFNARHILREQLLERGLADGIR